jgi:AraC family transcriptional regulator, regulatory protein of adaptative response / DNA-3-methyladenine glycosylase II
VRVVQIPYVHPFDWDGILQFLRLRAVPQLELVSENKYQRITRSGIVSVQNDPTSKSLIVETADEEVAPCIKRLFATDVDVRQMRRHLSRDPVLAPAVNRHSGMRVPGAWDPYEIIIRAIVGQQITVKAATTILGRIVAMYGESVGKSPLQYLFPTPERLASADFRGIGVPEKRCAAMRFISEKIHQGGLKLDGSLQLPEFVAQLTAFPGIGSWTAHYIAMRGFGYADAFPPGDVAVERGFSKLMGRKMNFIQLQRRAESWSPWRSYAVMHIWRSL